MLTQLIYSSHAKSTIDAKNLQDILESARKFNLFNDITGMLCYGDSRFMQYIEGERSAINLLYHRILNDERHKESMLLHYDYIQLREYSDWSMGFITADNPDIIKLLEKSVGMTNFRPETMSNTQAMAFIKCIKAELYPQMVVHVEDHVQIKDGRIQ